jgi:pyruvate/2-oxoglutarate dehydrogenase complex dihydrolipoamide acyltransferase (E2) component
MATSAATYTTALEAIAKEFNIPFGDIKTLLASKGLLPKKMLTPAKAVKEATQWASKAAQELATENHLSAKDMTPGTGKDGKITIKDVKSFMQAPIKKVNASPAALKFARDNGLDIGRIATGSGKDGKIVLSDVKDLTEPDPPADSDEELPAMSPGAKKAADEAGLDAEDLQEIEGTGKDGKIVLKDIQKYIKDVMGESEED